MTRDDRVGTVAAPLTGAPLAMRPKDARLRGVGSFATASPKTGYRRRRATICPTPSAAQSGLSHHGGSESGGPRPARRPASAGNRDRPQSSRPLAANRPQSVRSPGQGAAENLSLRVRQIQGNGFGTARRPGTGHGSYASCVLDGSSRSNAAGRRSMLSRARLAGCRAYTRQLVLVQDFPDASRVQVGLLSDVP